MASPTPLSRRQFLAATAGLAVVAACGGGGDDEDADVSVPKSDTSAPPGINLVVAGQFLSGVEQRVAFAVIDNGLEPLGAGAAVAVRVGTPDGKFGEPVEVQRHAEGIEERPYYVLRHTFAAPGTYLLQAATKQLSTRPAALQVQDPASVESPIPGRPMVATPSATTADPRGVDPVCTRSPACPWHDVSLDATLAEHRPLAVLFASPALCVSKTCGPVLDILLDLRKDFEGKVRFVHVEPYKSLSVRADNLSVDDLTDAFRSYKLQSEPFLFLAGPDGVVRERIDGGFDRGEAREVLTRLTS